MNGLMQWFKSSNKMKRWIFLILIGIMLACYGLAKILVMKEISFTEVGQVVVIFVIGFLAIVLGLIFLNKRTLEVLIESTDERMENKKNVNVKSLIFNKTVYDKGPNIVVIGGGTGLDTVLYGMKKYTNNLTAIVTISDYGEAATNSRKELQMLPLGDVKDSIVSLASKDGQIDKLFNYEFTKGKLRGLNFSDIYFSAMQEINGNFEDSILKSNEVLNMVGRVIPVTLDEMKIVAELANGYIVEEKSRIPEVVSDKITKINRILISPSNCKPAPGVIDAIKNADCIIIGPGSLYTNVIPNLLVNGVTKAIKESSAIKVYISNIMTEPGQTDNYSVSDYINAIIDHCGEGIIDYCLYDTGEVIPEFIKKYNIDGADLVEQDIEEVKDKKIKFMKKNMSVIKDDLVRHDATIIANTAIQLICDDLKYLDKQNEPEYLMMNSKLLADKKINREKRRNLKKKPEKSPNKEKSKSKFASKYSERIDSIKHSDERASIRKKKMIQAKRKKEENIELNKTRESNMVKEKKINLDKLEEVKKESKIELNNRDIRPKDYEKIRKEMLEKFNNSKLKD